MLLCKRYFEFLTLFLFLLATPALADVFAPLSPNARLDLAVLVTAYPGLITAIDVAPSGAISVETVDGGRFTYDDGRVKSPREALDDTDIEDMLAQVYPLGPIAAEPASHFSPGRQRVQGLFTALYGHAQDEVAGACQTIPFLGNDMAVSTRCGAGDAFARVNTALTALLAAHPEWLCHVLPIEGGMVWRVIAGTSRMSMHSFAVAVDLNPQGNPYWRDFPEGTSMLVARRYFPRDIVTIFEDAGFIWGGKWSEFDLMHFEYRPEILLKARILAGQDAPLSDIRPLLRAVGKPTGS